MNVSLTSELESWIASLVATGRYRSSSEVVREAVRLLQDLHETRALQTAQLRAMVQEGIAELDAGRSAVFDGDFAARVKLRGRDGLDSDDGS